MRRVIIKLKYRSFVMVDTKRFYLWLAGILGGGVILALGVFLGVVPMVQNLNKMAYLDILVTPNTAKVVIEGQEYRNAVHELEPGAYTATVELGDLAPEVVTLDLERGRTTGIYMSWSENGGWRYYTAEELAHENSIGGILPIYTTICEAPASRVNCNAVKVQYDRVPQCGNEECLVINGRERELTDEVVESVRGELANKGYDLDNYSYAYVQNTER